MQISLKDSLFFAKKRLKTIYYCKYSRYTTKKKSQTLKNWILTLKYGTSSYRTLTIFKNLRSEIKFYGAISIKLWRLSKRGPNFSVIREFHDLCWWIFRPGIYWSEKTFSFYKTRLLVLDLFSGRKQKFY